MILDEFRDALRAAGYETDDKLVADDRIHRAKVRGDRASELRYKIAQDGEFGYGWFVYKGEERHDWHSSKQERLTEAERRDREARIAARRQEADSERQAAQQAAAARAGRIWERSEVPFEPHDYATRKEVTPKSDTRIFKGTLVIPVRHVLSGALRSLQFIAADGRKRYLADGEKGVTTIKGSETVALCEGWATGESIHAATGWTVVVCFDTAGIKAYSEVARKIHGDCPVVICADDDAFVFRQGKRPASLTEDKSSWPSGDEPEWNVWRQEDLLVNPGMAAAATAAKKVAGNVRVASPKFLSLSSRPTDWNDLQCLEGIDAVREQLTSVPQTEDDYSSEDIRAYIESVPPDVPKESTAVAAPRDWREDLILTMTKKGPVPDKKTLNNIYLYTRYTENLRGTFILNEFSCRQMVVKCPPWEKQSKFKPRDINEEDYSRVTMELEKLGMSPTNDKVIQSVNNICRDRSFHPVKNFFNDLVWDRTPRLATWLTYYLGASEQPAEYLAGIGTKWLVAGVARVMQPGCKFDHMLILEGITDIGKSLTFRTLSTFYGESYFFDGLMFSQISDRDTMLKIQGNMIIEFPELSKLGSRDVEEVKQWITIQEDRGREPYGRALRMYPRQFILAGSTNNTEYLRDATGNKRFWPVACGDSIDIKALTADVEQLWAEAVHLYNEGYQWWIPKGDPLIALINTETQKRLELDPWHDIVLEFADERLEVRISDIMKDALTIPKDRWKKAEEMRVANILRIGGYLRNPSNKRWRRSK